jgi:acyl-CoA synthetase (AMP-forming)/AMP-acid ligase II
VIAGKLFRLAERHPQAPVIAGVRQRWTYLQLVDAARSVTQSLVDGNANRVGVWCDETPALVATLVALDASGIDAVLISAASTVDHVAKLSEQLMLSAIVTDKDSIPECSTPHSLRFRQIDFTGPKIATNFQPRGRDAEVILFTSGTSGQPKPAIHSWNTLSAAVNRDPKYAGRRWLLAYEPTSFAGIQVWLQALLTGGCLCVLDSRDPASVADQLVKERVEFASATPSFWRLLLLSAAREKLAQASLTQITLGGEPVDQPVLDALRSAFPNARITHIYASTEMGVCFSVSDGQAGFPAAYLADQNLPTELRIGNTGELEIRSRRAMLGYLPDSTIGVPTAKTSAPNQSQWFATGDLVERRGDRIYFVGRKSETINVGGMKVYPTDVEQCIRQVPGVQEVRVYSVPSSITGQLVGAEIQPAHNADLVALRSQVLGACRQRLARHQVPTSIKFRDRLPLNESGKVLRGEAVDRV